MSREFLLLFIPTIAAVSLTPGMCMTLAFSIGLTQGYRRTLFMMVGELLGVALVVSTTVLLLSWLLALDPVYFNMLAFIGASYLLWVAWRLWHAHAHFAARGGGDSVSGLSLFILGFTTAVMNPKGWGFMIALLPGFIDPERSVGVQLVNFLLIMLTIEFLAMSLYASGGRGLRRLLRENHNLAVLNKVAALLMVGVSILVFI